MTRSTLRLLVMAGAAIGLAACKDSTAPTTTLVSDAQITNDVAASAGDAAATEVDNLIGNELAAALPTTRPGFDVFGSPPTPDVTVTRTRTCYDANNAVVANCQPLSSVRKVVTHLQIDGTHSGPNFTAAVHRTRDETLTRTFNTASPPVEVSRTHDGVGTSHDTTSFSDGTISRTHAESAIDSINAVTWNLPHATNPFPVSGSIVRRVSVHATFQSATRSETRDVSKRIEVDFPADAQGNVVLKIDARTCTLNLVTHAVTNCH